MKKIRLLFAFTLFSFYSMFAYADIDCEAAVSTPEINTCARIEQAQVEKELNVVYQRVLKRIAEVSAHPETKLQQNLKQDFIEAQRLWIKLREADCQNVYHFWSGGTVRNVMYLGCMQSMAEQRIKALKRYETP